MPGRARTSHRREVALLALGAAALAVAMTWPIGRHVATWYSPSPNFADPLHQAWMVAWGGHALVDDRARLYDSNAFWPFPDSLVFSDPMIGYAPLATVGEGPAAAIIRYNLLTIFAYAFASIGAYVLAREMGLRPAAAAVAGAFYAYAPWRMHQLGHLAVISSGGIPLAVALLVRSHRRRRWPLALAGWGVATWQAAVAVTNAFFLLPVIGVLGVVGAVQWVRAPARRPDRRLLAAHVAGILLLGGWLFVQTRPYQRVLDAIPEARVTPEVAYTFSVPPSGWITAARPSAVWGRVTDPLHDRLDAAVEQEVFPGIGVLVLAFVGLRAPVLSRRVRAGLLAGATTAGILAMGYRFPGGGRLTYDLVYRYVPGWQGIRVPARFVTLMFLALGLLAAAGAQHALAAVARWPELRRERFLPYVAVGLIGVVLLEGVRTITVQPVPEPPAAMAAAPGPQYHLPGQLFTDAVYMFWSTDGFPDIVNGYGSIRLPAPDALRDRMTAFPDASSVEALRAYGVRSVLLHAGLAEGTPWERAAERPTDGLGLDVRRIDDVIVYTLAPDR